MSSLFRYAAAANRLTSNLLYDQSSAGMITRSEFFDIDIIALNINILTNNLMLNLKSPSGSFGQILEYDKSIITLYNKTFNIASGTSISLPVEQVVTLPKNIDISCGLNITTPVSNINYQHKQVSYTTGSSLTLHPTAEAIVAYKPNIAAGLNVDTNIRVIDSIFKQPELSIGYTSSITKVSLDIINYPLTLITLNGSFNISKRRLFILKKPKQKGNNYGSW